MAKDEGESSLNSTTKVKKKKKLFYFLGNQGSREKLFYKNLFGSVKVLPRNLKREC